MVNHGPSLHNDTILKTRPLFELNLHIPKAKSRKPSEDYGNASGGFMVASSASHPFHNGISVNTVVKYKNLIVHERVGGLVSWGNKRACLGFKAARIKRYRFPARKVAIAIGLCSGQVRAAEQTSGFLLSMPVIASSTVIAMVSISGVVPRSVIGVPVNRGGVTICRCWVDVCGRWRICIRRAGDGSTKERSPYKCPRDVPPAPRIAWLRKGQRYSCEKKQDDQNSLFHGALLFTCAHAFHFEQ